MTLSSKYTPPPRKRSQKLLLVLILGVFTTPFLALSFNKVHHDLGDAPWTIQDVGFALGLGLAIPGVVGLFLFIANKFNLTGAGMLRYGYWPGDPP